MVFLKLKTFIQKNISKKFIKSIYIFLSIFPALFIVFILGLTAWQEIDDSVIAILENNEQELIEQAEPPKDQKYKIISSATSDDHLFKAEIRQYGNDSYYQVVVTNLSTDMEKRIYSDDYTLIGITWIEDEVFQISRYCKYYCTYFKVIGKDESVNQKIPWEALSTVLIQDKLSDDKRYLLSERMEGSDPSRYKRIYITDLETGDKWQIYGGDDTDVSVSWLPDNQIGFVYNCSETCTRVKKSNINDITFVSSEPNEGMTRKNGWQARYIRSFNEDSENCIPFSEDLSKWDCHD